MMPIDRADRPPFYKLGGATVAGICIASAVYFGDILLRASEKYFWFDELFTIYLCRLPDFRSTWAAVTQGADFNPPLFYLLTRTSQHLFGEGLIGSRVPAIVGVWLFCLCIFLFVFRRNGPFAAFVAAVLPFFTLINYYAYEARPHGLVLGFCGLALVCWQRTKENGRGKVWWVAGFALSIAGALMTHIYAVYILVPFALAEIYHLAAKRRADWPVIAALAVPLAGALFAYVPLIRMYKSIAPASFFEASRFVIPIFYDDLMGPATWVFVLLAAILGVSVLRKPGSGVREASVVAKAESRPELVLAVAFVFLPYFGLVGCKLSHGLFVYRYFLASVAGIALLLGFALGRARVSAGARLACAVCMFVLLMGHMGGGYLHRLKHLSEKLIEPSSHGVLVLDTDVGHPMQKYSILLKPRRHLDIAVLSRLEFLYLYTYAPPAVGSRLYFVAPPNGIILSAYQRLIRSTRIDMKAETLPWFLKTHDHFMVYDAGDTTVHMSDFLAAGYKLESADSDSHGTMYEFKK